MEPDMPNCSIAGCEKASVARGWCHAHYKKWQIYGSPLAGTEKSRPNGSGTVNFAGYIAVGVGRSKKMQHVQVAERAIGKQLPAGAIVHHVNHDRQDNRNSNLVVCPNQSYHQLLHTREKALNASGNPNYRKCCHCKTYDSLDNLSRTGGGRSGAKYYHKKCRAADVANRKQRSMQNADFH